MKQVDVAIIGGGPAGIAAAIELAAHGASLVVIDSYPRLGGHYFRQPSTGVGEGGANGGERQAEYRSLITTVDEEAIDVLSETTVWSVFQEKPTAVFTLHLQGPRELPAVQATYLLLAPGAYDRPMPFPGWQLPGVITLGGAQMLLKGHGVLPGQRILVAGGGPLLFAAAAGLLDAGADVIAVLDTAPLTDGLFKMAGAFWGQGRRLQEAWRYLRTIRRRRVPLLFGHTVFKAMGEDGVTAAAYGRVDSEGHPLRQTEKVVELDTICIALGFLPNLALTRHLDCEHHYDSALDAFYPIHDDTMETTRPNLFVAGDVTGVGGKEQSQLQGQVAGLAILSKLGRLPPESSQKQIRDLEPAIRRERRFGRMVRDRMRVKPGFLELLDDETIVCRCEMVTVAQIIKAVQEGAPDLRGAKLRTRCGMGACQGRYCERSTAGLIARETGRTPESAGSSSVRPPLSPLLISDFLKQ